MLEQLTEYRETVYSKRIKLGKDGRNALGKARGKGKELPCPELLASLPPLLPVLQPGSS